MREKKERDLSIKLNLEQYELLKQLGERIKQARLENELSMAALAELGKVTEAIVRKVERGTPGVAIGRYLQVLAALGRAEDISQLLKSAMNKTVVILKGKASPRTRTSNPGQSVELERASVKVVARKRMGEPSANRAVVVTPKKRVAYPTKKLKGMAPVPEQPKPPKPASAVKRKWTARYEPPKRRGRKKKDTSDEVSES